MARDERSKDLVRRVVMRREEPSCETWLDIERLADDGVELIAELLDGENLSARRQVRALWAASVAAKHAGPRAQERVLDLALRRAASDDIVLRSRAIHVALVTMSISSRLVSGDAAERATRSARRERVAKELFDAVREAVRNGLRAPTDRLAQRFLEKGRESSHDS